MMMSKRAMVTLGFVMVLLAVGVAVVLLANQTTDKPSTTSSATASTANIEISATDFTPGTLTVKKGTTVTWTNNGSELRRIVSTPYPQHTDLPGLDSKQNISQGGSYSYTYTKSGSYGYLDYLHPTLSGVVIVE